MGFLRNFFKNKAESKASNIPRYHYSDFKLKQDFIESQKTPPGLPLNQLNFDKLKKDLDLYFKTKLGTNIDSKLNAILLKYLEQLSSSIFTYMLNNNTDQSIFADVSFKPKTSYHNYTDMVKFIQYQIFSNFYFDDKTKKFRKPNSLILLRKLKEFNDVIYDYLFLDISGTDLYNLGIFNKFKKSNLILAQDKNSSLDLIEKEYGDKFKLFYARKFGSGSYNRLPLKYHKSLKRSLDVISGFELHLIDEYDSDSNVIKFLKSKNTMIKSYFLDSPLYPLIKFDNNVLLRINKSDLLKVMDKNTTILLDKFYYNLVKDFKHNHPTEKTTIHSLEHNYSSFKASFNYLSSYNLSILSSIDVKAYENQFIIFKNSIIFLIKSLIYYTPKNSYSTSIIHFLEDTKSFIEVYISNLTHANTIVSNKSLTNKNKQFNDEYSLEPNSSDTKNNFKKLNPEIKYLLKSLSLLKLSVDPIINNLNTYYTNRNNLDSNLNNYLDHALTVSSISKSKSLKFNDLNY